MAIFNWPSIGQWQYQLTGNIDISVACGTFDIDIYDVSAATVRSLHDRGRCVIGYFSAGTYENWRPDAGAFPSSVLGNNLEDWPGERYLDVRRLDVLRPIMAARMDLAKSKGFDGVEPDNVDGWQGGSGFPLTSAHGLAYLRMLKDLAHERGLLIGLKNDLEHVTALVDEFDFAVNEQAFQYNEYQVLREFIRQGKPVLNVEYDLGTGAFCSTAVAEKFYSIKKSLSLGAPRTACGVPSGWQPSPVDTSTWGGPGPGGVPESAINKQNKLGDTDMELRADGLSFDGAAKVEAGGGSKVAKGAYLTASSLWGDSTLKAHAILWDGRVVPLTGDQFEPIGNNAHWYRLIPDGARTVTVEGTRESAKTLPIVAVFHTDTP